MNKLDSILAKAKKSYSDAFIDPSKARLIPRLQLDSPQMNYIFGGGFAKGRMYELYGPESSGKTTVCTYLAIQNQKFNKEKPVVLYIDFERTYDFEHAEELGLNIDPERFVLIQPYTGEDAFEIIRDVIEDPETPVGLIIWDSLGATATRAGLEDMFRAQYGGVAKLLSEGLKDIAPYLSKREISLIMINQERAQIGFSPVPNAASSGPGGYARKFWASWRARVTRVEWIKDKTTGEMSGIKMKIRGVKSKIGIPCREALLALDFKKGFDSDGEYMQFILDLLCVKEGQSYCNDSWKMINEKTGELVPMKIRGRDNAAEFLTNYFKEHREDYEEAKIKVNQLICEHTVLDKDVTLSEEELEKPTEEEVNWAAQYTAEDEE